MSESKGRGELLKKLRELQNRPTRAGDQPPEEQLPPKARGRAQLLQKLQKMKEEKVGGELVSTTPTPSRSTPGPSSVASEARQSAGDMGRLTKGVSELSLATTEPVSYRGQSGTKIHITSNYVRLEVEKDRGVFEYEVRFNPDIDAKSNRIKLVNQSLGELATTKVYDGDVCLYLPLQAFPDRKEFDNVIPHTEEPVKILMIYKRKRKMSECLHLYNVLFKRIMHILLYQRMGRNYFSPDHKHTIPQHKLEVLPGFAIHVDEMEGGLMICLDTTHRVIRSQTVYEYFQELRASNPGRFKEEARKIIGEVVLTKYNNKTYTVDDISWEMNLRNSFETRSGGSCTFFDYYKQHHNITVQDIDQPLLINLQTRKVGDTEVEHKVCLVPELCYLTGLSDVMRNDFKVMKDVGMYTRVTPNQRRFALRTWLQNVEASELAQKVLAGWGLRLAGATPDIEGRVFDKEVISFGGGKQFRGGADWNKAVSDANLTGPVDIHIWQLYYTRRDQKYGANFAETLVRLARGMGCIINPPQHIVLNDDRTETYKSAIQENIKENTEVAVFVCPTQRTDRYTIIKKMCCINYPVASQVILSKTLANQQKVRTIIHKIGMQITCKLGGALWNVKIPVVGWMICGIDAYHGANNQSVNGFVASINSSHTKYYSQAYFQGNEVGDFYKVALTQALIAHKEQLGSFPKKIVVFRDGVGDGQLNHCKQYEITQMMDAIRQMGLETELTFVVVQKRINTRIFEHRDDGAFENPPPGTVVDSVVTRRHLADFFLVPQSVRQGTVNPTHYIILHDDGNTKPDHIQKLAFKLCHLYFNWSGTIRVPAPCMYAHKLAAMVGQYLKTEAANKLNDRLWFL